MSYVGRRSQLGATTTADKTPGKSPDLVATWAAIKDAMRKTLGEYQFADNSLLTFDGRRCPMATLQQANVVLEWLARVGDKMTHAAAKAGRSTSSMDAALVTFKANISKFKSKAQNTFAGRLPLEASFLFINAADRYCIAMSAAQYAAFTNGTPVELWTEALSETPGGGALLGIWNTAKATVAFVAFLAGNFGTILKIALIGGAGYVGYRFYKKMSPRVSTAMEKVGL